MNDNEPHSLIRLLEEIRVIAQTGLNFAKDPYDLERYERLFKLSVAEYSNLSELSENEIREKLKRDIGQITPKVAGSAAIFSDSGDIFLIRRTDDRKWSIPGGFSEVYETPVDTAERETLEETGLKVKAESLIDVFCRFAGTFGNIHTTYSLMYYCTVQGGHPSPTAEAVEVGYFDHREIPKGEWHRDFYERIERAYQFWTENLS